MSGLQSYYPNWNDVYGIADSKVVEVLLESIDIGKSAQRALGAALRNIPWKTESVDISRSGRTQGGFGYVYTSAVYQGKKCVMKLLRKQETDLSSFFLESTIQCILHNYTKQTKCKLQVPEVYRFCKWRHPKERAGTYFVLIMERIEGEELNYFNGRQLRKNMKAVLEGLRDLHKISFVHRDFHSGNILIDNKTSTPYMIDFGNACVSNSENESALYDRLLSWTTTCKNRSHDVCYLILNLVTSYNKVTLRKLAIDICKKYKTVIKQSPDPKMDKDRLYENYHWKDNIFHWHYCYLLEDVEIELYRPKTLLRRLPVTFFDYLLKF